MRNKVFASNLRLLRKRFKLTQKELADKVGVSWEMISRYENAKTMPDWSTFLQLAKALHVSPATLLDSNLKFSEPSLISHSSVRVPLLISSKGIKNCEDLTKTLNRASTFFILSGNTFMSNENQFVMFASKTSIILPNVFKFLQDYTIYLVFTLLAREDTYKESSLYLVLGTKTALVFGRNIIKGQRPCAQLERLIVDFD